METYIIKGGQEGADRLRILANVMWPYTQPFLQHAGLREGTICLDVGCGNGEISRRMASIIGPQGHVTGIDFDPSVIQIAKQDHSNISNVDFKVLDIVKQDPEPNAYDFIFCRFILSHLPSPKDVIQKLKNALRHDGILAIEDVDFKGHFSFPPSRAFDSYVHWYEQIGLRKGANPNIGPALLMMLTSKGFHDIRLNVETPTFGQGDGKRMALLTLQAISDAIISSKLATKVEVEEILRELQAYTDDPLSIMSLPRIFQVVGRLHQNIVPSES